ncbi:hypothetical protein ACIREE_16075 [Streptomyces sp. NPDC102467]|uniref:hypothetical protein n=1 Tax=Streptomyces sp. NPDC102467 TaxID=3366179 RepID=UPI00381D8092
MAKNKNRKQAAEQNRASSADQAPEQSKSSSAPDAEPSMESQIMGNPSDVARKHQRRFGHN